MVTHLALDTEDDSNGNVTIINFFDGLTHTTFTGSRMRPRAWAWLERRAPDFLWACNLEYDLVNLYGARWVGKECTLTYVSAGLMRATFRNIPGCKAFDTLRHWSMSVADMGQYLGLPKLEKNFRSVTYCRRDTEIVWRFVQEMLKRYESIGLTTIKATCPSMALSLFRTMNTLPLDVPQHLSEWFREGYFGGRVECYRLGVVTGRINHYDVNSLFPFVMATQKYPALDRWRFTARPRWDRDGMVRGTVRVPQSRYPPLPVRTHDETIYPWGEFTGTWTYPEIRQLLRDGGRVIHISDAVEFSQSCNPFSRYVRFCHRRKQAAPKGSFDAGFWKLMLNSLYGKFGSHDGLFMIHNDRELTLDTHAAHANVVWAAYVTAYARLHLLRLLRSSGTVFYTDTDSLFTLTRHATANRLGALGHVGTYSRCRFVGNKLYTAGRIVKAKGVRPAVAGQFITTGRAVFRAPVRYRESRRRHGVKANQWIDRPRVMRAEYTKRRVDPDGVTHAWNYAEYCANIHGA